MDKKSGCVTVLTKGFVRQVNHDNGDLSVVNAARVSFAKEHATLDPEKDPKLIRYLHKHNHWTPFGHARYLYKVYAKIPQLLSLMAETPVGSRWKILRLDSEHAEALLSTSLWQAMKWGLPLPFQARHCESDPLDVLVPTAIWLEAARTTEDEWWDWPEERPYTLHVKLPIFVARQWMRSNGGIVYNEVSRRYVDDEPEFWEPKLWRGRPKSAKQGSEGEIPGYWDITPVHDKAVLHYNHLLACDIAPEMARAILPQSMYTEFWMTASLSALKRFYKLRIDPHAQWEIQQYAKAIGELIPDVTK